MIKILSLILLIAVCIPSAGNARSIHWSSCANSQFHDWFDTSPSPHPDLRCGYLKVPLQYKDGSAREAGSEMIMLALTQLPAKGVRKGSLVMISGGPGISGIDLSLDTEWPVSSLRESWDIVRYDPRGVGRSTPGINCSVPHQSAPTTTTRELRAKLHACAVNTGIRVLRHIGTDEAVSDVDRIRQALGDQKLTAVAYSYGTQVALLYAERFPSATRAMVLDGVVDIDEAKDSFTVALNQSLGYQNTFVRFARWCAKTRSCPLSAESEVATRQYQHLLRQLHEQPLHTAEGRTVSASELISLTTGLLPWRSSWPELATAVRQLDQGIVSLEVSRLLDYATSFGDPDALNVISCVDQSVPAQNQGEILRQKEQIREAFAATNYLPQKTDTPDLCDLWPWRSNVMNKRPQHVPILPPLLFVAQRYDPTTPWENARAMASKFRSPLLTREGDGHTLALSGLSVCVDKMVVSYLINPDKKHKDRVCY